MIRVPIPFEPTNLTPTLSVRTRREVSAYDRINVGFVEQWQTGSPRPQGSIDGRGGRYGLTAPLANQDSTPIASRLYREDMRAAQPFVPPTGNTGGRADLVKKISDTLVDLAETPGDPALQERYRLQTMMLKQSQTDTLAQNPYFAKYDVASDSRNIVRELRSSVTEDVVDRGDADSKRLVSRSLEGRFATPRGAWTGAQWAEREEKDSLQAYELMRPRTNDMTRVYRSN